jgi:hypothetical protein
MKRNTYVAESWAVQMMNEASNCPKTQELIRQIVAKKQQSKIDSKSKN